MILNKYESKILAIVIFITIGVYTGLLWSESRLTTNSDSFNNKIRPTISAGSKSEVQFSSERDSLSYLISDEYYTNIFVSGDYAYLTTDRNLAIIDVRDPKNPGPPIHVNISIPPPFDVFVSDNFAYISLGSFGIAIIDVSDPTNPGTPIHVDIGVSAYQVFISGDYAYIAGGRDLAVIDVSDPTNPGTPIYVTTLIDPKEVFISGDYAYVVDDRGLAILDVRNPSNLGTPVYANMTYDYPIQVFVSGGYAYVTDTRGLAIIDVSNPSNPGTPLYINTTFHPAEMYVSSDFVFFAALNYGFATVDVSDPTASVTTIDDSIDYAFDVFRSGIYVYVTTDTGLIILDVSNITKINSTGRSKDDGIITWEKKFFLHEFGDIVFEISADAELTHTPVYGIKPGDSITISNTINSLSGAVNITLQNLGTISDYEGIYTVDLGEIDGFDSFPIPNPSGLYGDFYLEALIRVEDSLEVTGVGKFIESSNSLNINSDANDGEIAFVEASYTVYLSHIAIVWDSLGQEIFRVGNPNFYVEGSWLSLDTLSMDVEVGRARSASGFEIIIIFFALTSLILVKKR